MEPTRTGRIARNKQWLCICLKYKDYQGVERPQVLSRKQINELLWNKLPIDYTDEQKIGKIGNLLTKLRKKGIIYTDEKRLWHLSEI